MSVTDIDYPGRMTRWQPDARDRLTAAAYELYEQRGYERTTVAEIAQAAGLSERTFFRHFADKREVLFSGSSHLLDGMVAAALAAPDDATPFEVVTAALEAVSVFLQPRHPHSARRQALIVGTAELQERELAKMATLTAATADALRQRGVGDPTASLAAEAGIAVFRVAFERWVAVLPAESDATPIASTDVPLFLDVVHDCLAELRAVTG